MIRPKDIPQGWHCWSNIYVPDHMQDHAGWVAPDQVSIRDCVPTYRLPGGGISEHSLTNLPEAIDRSVANLERRINQANALINRLKQFKEKVSEL